MKDSLMYFIHCLSPVHVGAGQGVGLVDLPIVRERITEWPVLPGSSLKGVKRDYFTRLYGEKDDFILAAFGNSGSSDGNAGAFVISDGRILAFPVASRYGTFAYATCPLVIRRMLRDAAAAAWNMPNPDLSHLEQAVAPGKNGPAAAHSEASGALVTTASKLVGPGREGGENVYLDEFEFQAIRSDDTSAFAKWVNWLASQLFEQEDSRAAFKERFVLVSDEAFNYFATMCCEVATRVRIMPDTKTVQDGALWTEEYLPAEAVLYGILWCDKIYAANSRLSSDDLLSRLPNEMLLQIGGNATVGKGRARFCLPKEEQA